MKISLNCFTRLIIFSFLFTIIINGQSRIFCTADIHVRIVKGLSAQIKNENPSYSKHSVSNTKNFTADRQILVKFVESINNINISPQVLHSLNKPEIKIFNEKNHQLASAKLGDEILLSNVSISGNLQFSYSKSAKLNHNWHNPIITIVY